MEAILKQPVPVLDLFLPLGFDRVYYSELLLCHVGQRYRQPDALRVQNTENTFDIGRPSRDRFLTCTAKARTIVKRIVVIPHGTKTASYRPHRGSHRS
jgi:hypothetical protein